jgi:hypothetical protein
MPETVKRTHTYDAMAKVLGGDLRLPLVQKVVTQAHAGLEPTGGYRAQHTTGYRLEGVLSYSAGHSQVAGNASTKPGGGWSTITTTVIEDLNVLEVLTADRVVGQIITEHPAVGYVPQVTFLGTRIENLRVAGHPVNLEWDMHILDKKPEDDAPYTLDPVVLGHLSSQHEEIAKHTNLPPELAEHYNLHTVRRKSREGVEWSLVKRASGHYPGYSWGNVIRVPHFGTIVLAKVTLTHEDWHPEKGVPKKTYIELTMIDLKLGCAIDGDVPIGSGGTNGNTWP